MKNATWNDCVAFHGHSCGGLTIGWKAALYAIELLELKFSDDEEVCCICENDGLLRRRHTGHARLQRGQGQPHVPPDREDGLQLLRALEREEREADAQAQARGNEPPGEL